MEYFEELTSLFESEDADLFRPSPKRHIVTADDHLIESFSKITLFVKNYGRIPNTDSVDLNEAVLGTQLNTIKSDKKKYTALEAYDELGLLELEKAPESLEQLFTDDPGLFGNEEGIFEVDKLPRTKVVDKNTGDTAKREPIKNFTPFKHLFNAVDKDLENGSKKLKKFYSVNEIKLHGFYVIEGMMCYIESIGEPKNVFGRNKERLRVIYANGTESNIYLRTLASQLYEASGFSVVDPRYNLEANIEKAVGHIYVLKSLSEDPEVNTIKDLHKIGVTKGSVAKRIKNASNDPTYLMAPVRVLEDYRLTGDYIPQKIEALIHRVFGHVKVDLEITDKDGVQYTPSEWYSVPHSAILEAIELIGTKEIVNYIYDAEQEKMVLK